MKTPIEIELRKVRKQLSKYGLTEEEKNRLRETLHHLKTLRIEEKKNISQKEQN